MVVPELGLFCKEPDIRVSNGRPRNWVGQELTALFFRSSIGQCVLKLRRMLIQGYQTALNILVSIG